MYRYLFGLSLFFLIGCASRSPKVEQSFGSDFTADGVMSANQLLTAYSEDQLVDTVTAMVRGTVNEVCQAKGCWLTMQASADKEMMVKFKDYAFFVPMDIGEREVILHGKAFYQLTPIDELQHYARDAGKSEEEVAAITEAKKELHFLADGVQLL